MDQGSSVKLAEVRKLIAVSSLSAITLAFVMVLLFKLINSLISTPVVNNDPRTAECSELHDECGNDMVCQSGVCVPLAQPERCQVGDPCSSKCEPGQELRCSNDNIYVQVSWDQPEVCHEQKVIDFLSVLNQKCRSAESCTSQQFSDIALQVRELYRLLADFHDLTSMHFPGGKPGKGNWPSDDVAAHYIARLRPRVQAYKDAKVIFLVATASPGSKKADNDRVAYARTQKAIWFIEQAAKAEGLSPTEIEAIRKKTRIAQIGDQRPIEYGLYNALFGQSTVAWSSKYEVQLRGLIEQGEKINNSNRRWRDRTINQTVFIVPVPCEVNQ